MATNLRRPWLIAAAVAVIAGLALWAHAAGGDVDDQPASGESAGG